MDEIKIVRIVNTNDKVWEEAIQIYEEAFPVVEKRPIEQHIQLMEENLSFQFYAAMDNERVVGIVVLWKLSGFIYLDYLATSSDSRNKGYGKIIMRQLQDTFGEPIVLEVEIPDNELSERRVGFYTRLGFNLLDFPYFMPKYNNPKEQFPMLLMSFPDMIDQNTCRYVMNQIHTNAYNI